MKVAVVGSRNVSNIDIERYMPKNINLIISGGANGIDTLSENYAKNHNIQSLILKPNYKKYGKMAPLIRNQEIVDKSDVVIAFWDTKSKGTEYVINYANSQNKKVIVHKVLKFPE